MIELQSEHKEVLTTPWFKVIAKQLDNSALPYYVVQSTDAVCILAMTNEQKVLLVQQYRPAVDCETLELPGGHMKNGEAPEEAAKRELLEETGYQADALELSGVLFPNTTRLSYKLWCYFATNATKLQDPQLSEISNLIFCSPSELSQFIKNGKIKNALDIAAIFLSLENGKLASYITKR